MSTALATAITEKGRPLRPSGSTTTTQSIPRRAEDAVTTGLTPERELELVRRWQDEADGSALEMLVKACTPRVEYIARRYRHYPVEHQDLVGEGFVGLMTGINRFDPTRGVRLMTYASFWVRAEMVRSITADWGHGKTGIGITRTKVFFRLRRERSRCELQAMDEETMVRTLARTFDLSEHSTRRLLQALDVREFSMDAIPAGCDHHEGHLEVVMHDAGPDSLLEDAQRNALFTQLIGDALETLGERELFILEQRYISDEPESLAALGRCLGISRERVRQIEQSALAKMGRRIERTGFTTSDMLGMVA